MTKKLYPVLAVLFCLTFIFSAASAYDVWDHYQGPVIFQDPTEEPVTVSAPTEEPVSAPLTTEEPVIEVIPTEGPAVTPNETGRTVADGLRKSPAADPISVINVPQTDPVIPEILSGSSDGAREVTLTLDSIRIYGLEDPYIRKILDKLEGMRFRSVTQSGNSRSGFSFSMQNKDILTYELQNGTPYYVKSNFLGENTYMILPEDRFEENLVSAFYDLVEQVSDDTSQLPPKEEVITMIGTFRDTISGGTAGLPPVSLELTQQVDPTALMGVVMNVMTRFRSAEPTQGIGYRFADFDAATLEYEWPEAASLPAVSEADSATAGTFTGKDLLDLLDALPVFLSDNPELSEALNGAIIQVIQRAQPGTEIPAGTDVLSELIQSMKESVQKSPDTYVTLKIDNDRYGAPALITAEIGKPDGDANSGAIITIMPVSGSQESVLDFAIDAFHGDERLPIFRLLSVSSPDKSFSLNARFADPDSSDGVEFALVSRTDSITEAEHTTFSFTAAGQRGDMTIDQTPLPNAFGGKDTTSLIVYEHTASGQQVFLGGNESYVPLCRKHYKARDLGPSA